MSSPPFIHPLFARGNLMIYHYLFQILCFSPKQMFVSVIFFVVCLKNGLVKMFARKERGLQHLSSNKNPSLVLGLGFIFCAHVEISIKSSNAKVFS